MSELWFTIPSTVAWHRNMQPTTTMPDTVHTVQCAVIPRQQVQCATPVALWSITNDPRNTKMEVQLFAVLVAFFFFAILFILETEQHSWPGWARLVGINTDTLKCADLCPHAFKCQCAMCMGSKLGIVLKQEQLQAVHYMCKGRDASAATNRFGESTSYEVLLSLLDCKLERLHQTDGIHNQIFCWCWKFM